MWRLTTLALIALLCCIPLFAQSTTVSGQVTDAGSQAWNNGTFSFVFAPNPNYPVGPYIWTGGTLNTTISGSLNATGGYSVSIPSNSSITPQGSKWTATFCPQASSGCFTVQNISITGGTQTVNATPPAIVINLQLGVPPILAYSTSEVTGVVIGSQFYLLGTGPQVCNAVSGNTCTTWGAVGGGVTQVSSLPATCTPSTSAPVQLTVANGIYGAGVVYYCDSTNHYSPISQGSGAAPIARFYLSSQCPPSNSAQCFNTPADTQQANACSYTSAQPDLTCLGQVQSVTASVTSNVATYFGAMPSNFASGDSVTVTGFGPSDSFFNQTCTLTAATATSISCALTHANASSTTIGTVVDSATTAGPFVSTDCIGGSGCTGVGTSKRAFAYYTCSASNNLFANSNNGPFTTSAALTIATFINSTHVTLSGNAANTIAQHNAGSGIGPGACAVWGHPDDSGAALMDTAMQASKQCPRGNLVNNYYFFTTPHFFTNPPACAALGVSGGVNAGNIVYSSGYEFDGAGAGTTVLFLPPGFPETGSCKNGFSTFGCFVIPLQGRWSHIQITGGGNRLTPNAGVSLPANPAIILEVDGPASLDNYVCTNIGQGSPTYGLGAFMWTQLTQINLSACGRSPFATNVSSSVTAIKMWIENVGDYEGAGIGELTDYNTQTVSLFSKYNLICYDCTINQEPLATGSPAFELVDRHGMNIKWYRGALATQGGPTVNGNVGYDCVASGCVLDMEDASVDFSVPAGDQNNVGLQCASACTVYIKNSIIKGSATGGFAYKDVAGSKLFDMGGNTWGTFSLSGAVIGEANSANQVLVTAPKTVLSAGWGTTAAVTALTGGDFPIQFTVTNSGTGQGASPTITYTFPSPLAISPLSCTATQIGGTNATGTFTSSSLSSTGVTFTFSLTPTASSTETVQVVCVTP